MSQDRSDINVKLMPPGPCSHIGRIDTFVDTKSFEKVYTCSSCDHEGPNLWICLQQNCLLVGCSEQAKDHSTEHFQRHNKHCVQMNLSSQRIWCYICEREVFLDVVRSSTIYDAFLTSISSRASKSGDGLEDAKVNVTGLVGLQNIANTCYMNSALQALSNVQPMTHYFLTCTDLIEHTTDQHAHRSKAGLAKSYARLMKDIWCKLGSKKDYVAPRSILYGIRTVHPMFRGFQQHDTQEFLRCFMDQLHEELKENMSPLPDASAQKGATLEQKQSNDVINHTDDEPISVTSSVSGSSSVSETEYETCDSTSADHSNIFINQLRSGNALYNNETQTKVANSPSPTAARSIITDVFDGKLLSSVQCLTCDRISTREETFQDLSLPIPNRDYLNVLHQTHSLSSQSLNSIDSMTPRANDSWFTWIWNFIRSWLWGPSVTLHDCMASFFSADELKGDNMYSCDKCNKLRTGVKYSQILDLPEVLCIHLKRFRHDLSYSSKISSHVHFPLEGFDMRPYIHKDCMSRVMHYNLVSIICHHGTVGGGHYTCFARNEFSDRWYEFDDQHITEVTAETVQNCQAYVLFYQKHNPNMAVLRSKAKELSLLNPVNLADIRFFVSREWLSRFSTFAEPGEITNGSMLCVHGGILHSKKNLLNQIALPISQPLWDFLYQNFGGGPAINVLFECELCKSSAESLARRQLYELSVFTKYNEMVDDTIESSAIFAISMPWLRKWQQFARSITHKEPGAITNNNIAVDLSPNAPTIGNVRPGSDYAQLKAPLWKFLHGIYGGGPEILLRKSLVEETVSVPKQCEEQENYGTVDLSDTESNLGLSATCNDSDCTLAQTNEILANHLEGDKMQQHLSEPVFRPRNGKQAAQFLLNSRKSKINPVRTTFRKKSRKSRAALKNSDLFGPKGKFNLVKDTDMRENVTFQNGNREFSGARTDTVKNNALFTRPAVVNDSDNKDPVILQKMSFLKENCASAETDI